MARYPQAILVSCEIPWDDDERLLEGKGAGITRGVLVF